MAKRIDSDQEHGDQEPQRRLSAFDRVLMTALGDGRTVGLPDDPAATEFPEVWRWLTQTEGGKDHILQPAVITMQLGPEGALVSLTHRDLKTSCSVACPHLGQALQALERALNDPNPPLRTWGKDPQVRLKKRKPK